MTDKQKIKDIMGGERNNHRGGDTANLHDGTPETVHEDIRKNLDILK